MDFSDEPYVRKYPRKTVTNRLLGWEGRAVLDAMLGEFDAAGIFEIRGDAARCIVAVTEIPLEVVQVALARLIETETWVVTARSITWPTYEEAQNCTRSDRLRKRESRRARSAQSVTDVTSCPPRSQPVTDCPEMSQDVTLPPSAPILPSPHPSSPPEQDPDPERAREDSPKAPAPEPERFPGAVGVSRTLSLPTEAPPQAYLDEAVMRGVDPRQARSTWAHYRGAGLPTGGVERLYEWLCQRAKERTVSQAKVAAASPRGRPGLAPQLEPTKKHLAFAKLHGLEHEIAPIIVELTTKGVVEDLGPLGALEELGKRLSRAAKQAGGKTAVAS